MESVLQLLNLQGLSYLWLNRILTQKTIHPFIFNTVNPMLEYCTKGVFVSLLNKTIPNQINFFFLEASFRGVFLEAENMTDLQRSLLTWWVNPGSTRHPYCMHPYCIHPYWRPRRSPRPTLNEFFLKSLTPFCDIRESFPLKGCPHWLLLNIIQFIQITKSLFTELFESEHKWPFW